MAIVPQLMTWRMMARVIQDRRMQDWRIHVQEVTARFITLQGIRAPLDMMLMDMMLTGTTRMDMRSTGMIMVEVSI